ncbi:MAG: hypothetical protein EP330_05210 [Deltaproteobacteria bacterium]|nr:MAG: hypothetical protein EP330_05210 [Deltaproteobacteria bacterium]
MPTVSLVLGNLVEADVDAIVNAANATLLGGGGVDGAIHRAAGPELVEACRALPLLRPGVRCEPGDARATPAYGALRCRVVIHAVGPRYAIDPEPASLLAGVHRRALKLAVDLGCRSVAFPAISTGAYGYPLDEAAPIALAVARQAWDLDEVRFVLFDQRAYDAFARARDDG